MSRRDPQRPAMLKPFVYEGRNSRSLHFSIYEVQSIMRRHQPDELDLEYTRRMMAFLWFNCRPAQIAMIGLGGGSMVKFAHRHLPQTRMTVVEINPYVIDLRGEFEIPDDDSRLQILEADGAQFVRQTAVDAPVEVLLVDGFDQDGIPDALCSEAFYKDCRSLLAASGGLLVVNLHCAHSLYAVHIERIRRCFGHLLCLEDDARNNGIVFASSRALGQCKRSDRARVMQELDTEAWRQLAPAFAQIESALGVAAVV